jgi:hypothetical protein
MNEINVRTITTLSMFGVCLTIGFFFFFIL